MEWEKIAKTVIKTELVKRGLSYEQLTEKLNSIGVTENSNAINRKINRGTFQFSFFLQCAYVLGIKNLSLDDSYFKQE